MGNAKYDKKETVTRAYWIENRLGGVIISECSNCGYTNTIPGSEEKYIKRKEECPICGAMMSGHRQNPPVFDTRTR